jgi:hypothetical protein
MFLRILPYLLLIAFALLIRANGFYRVIADLCLLLIPLVYLWKLRELQVFNVSGLLILPVYLSVWSVNTALVFSLHDLPGRDVAKIGALCFLTLAMIWIALNKDSSQFNERKKETFSLNLFLYFMLGLCLIVRW